MRKKLEIRKIVRTVPVARLAVIVILASTQLVFAQEGFPPDSVVTEPSAPRFERYRVGNVYSGKAVAVKLNSPNARMFRTRLRESASEGVNFAGHYIVATWGCGSGCMSFAIIDARTGLVYFPPSLLLVSTPMGQELERLEFRKSSRLLKIVGSRNDEGAGTYFYDWKNNRLRLIRAYENKQVK